MSFTKTSIQTACLLISFFALSSGRPVLDASKEVHRELEVIGRDIDQGMRSRPALNCDLCQDLASARYRQSNLKSDVESRVHNFCMTLQYEGYTSPSQEDCFYRIMQEMLDKDGEEQDDYRVADLICIYYGSCTNV